MVLFQFLGTGDFLVMGIFPLRKNSNDTVNYQNGVMFSEAMRYAVNRINTMNFLHGYKLKIDKMVTCFTEYCVRDSLLDAYLGGLQFLIGPYSSETSYFASILTDTFRIPAISYSATYSDFMHFGKVQSHMFRTVPSDDYRILAALDFIQQSEWTYVSVISSHGYDGERDAIPFIQKLSSYGACLSSQVSMPRFKDDRQLYEKIIDQMVAEKRLKALVLFTTNEDSRNIFNVLKLKKLIGRFTILCMYGCVNYQDVLEGNEEIANGTLSLYVHNTEVEDFRKSFLALKPKNHPYRSKYFDTFWENVFQCSINDTTSALYEKKCTGNEQLREGQGYYPLTPVHTVLDAVYGVAIATRLFLESICNKDNYKNQNLNKTTCIVDASDTHRNTRFIMESFQQLAYEDGTLKVLKPGNLSFIKGKDTKIQYDVGRYVYSGTGKSNNQLIWKWEVARDEKLTTELVEKNRLANTTWVLTTGNDSSIIGAGICSQQCGIGEYQEHDRNYLKAKCCWTCRKCPTSHIVRNNTCIKCQKTEFPDEKRLKCLALPLRKIASGSNIISIVFILFTVIGLFLTISVALIFSRHNNNRVVRASGRDLCYTIMIGLCMAFSCPFVFLTEASKITCILRGALPGFAFLTCYAPLFLKTNRIYRIFFSARVSVTRPSLVSSQSQFAALFGVLAVQIIVSVVWFISQVPLPVPNVSKDYSYVTIRCSSDSNPILLLLNLSLSVLFMICCTVLAFKTRHFPKNYNEAKYIGITLYVTCVVWSLFLPIFFLSRTVDYDFLREYLMCIVCILIGFVTLFGIFGPKILMIYQAPPQGSNQGSLPTWYVTNSKDNDHDNDHDNEQENTVFTTTIS